LKAVILVGGQGTRLRPLTCNIPKAIVPILNKPFLVHLLYYLKSHGVNKVILAMGYNPEPIRQCLAGYNKLGVEIEYVIEDVPLGTAGAVKNTAQYLDDTFIVFNGDILTDIDLSEMIDLHRQLKPEASIALTPVDNPSIYGVVETNASNMVQRFVEKPPPEKVTTNMINAGIYILEPEVLQRIPESGFCMFERQVFPEMLLQKQPFLGYKSDAYWIDIGTPEKYMKANQDLLNRIPGRVIILDEESNINGSTKLFGPALIGKNCHISEDTQVKGSTIIGPGCTIENNIDIEGSIIWDGVHIAANTSLKNCIIGSNCIIGAANTLEDCIIGDNVIVKASSKIEPGSRIWPEGCTEE
jgi:mannose-1-phosphate guanylyltransferase